MIPDLSTILPWLQANPHTLQGIHRGIEREGLRININGSLAKTPHPSFLGAALTHKWITTDFAEALLEFITPVDDDMNHMFALLRDVHRHVARHLGHERLWPMSMPCFLDSTQPVELAQYGSSNIGRMKTLYREGLRNRYSAIMQMIAGVHYNFSLPLSFWKAYYGIRDAASGKNVISAGYLRLIRNYYRFGWILPYLFGASPGICPSFLNNRITNFPFEYAPSGLLYLPYATSLRLSNLGYTNQAQSQLGITFNDLHEYINALKQAMNTPSADYQRIGLKRDGHYLQLNTNMLQTENEFYAPIRPKRVSKNDESPSEALIRDGIGYVEVRSLDINPFSLIGVEKEQAYFLDLFLIWCTLVEAPQMTTEELLSIRKNWNLVILEGRKPGLMLSMNNGNTTSPLKKIGKLLFRDLLHVAEILDSNSNDMRYQKVCYTLVKCFDDPERTLSARFLNQLIKYGIQKTGVKLANDYRQMLYGEALEVLSDAKLNDERIRSWQQQRALESADSLSFHEFLVRKKNNQKK